MVQVGAQATLMPRQEGLKGAGKWKARTKCPKCSSPIAVPPEYDSKEAAFAALKKDLLQNHWRREHPTLEAPTLNF